MSDEKLRKAGRASLESSPARLLLERLRVEPPCHRCEGRGLQWMGQEVRCWTCCGFGSAFRRRLGLAAYCGSADAREVLGESWLDEAALRGDAAWMAGFTAASVDGLEVRRHGVTTLGELRVWTDGLVAWGDDVLVRAGVAAGFEVLPLWCDGTRLSGRAMHAERALREGRCGRCTKLEPSFGLPGDVLRYASLWLRHPCEECRAHWAQAWGSCEDPPGHRPTWLVGPQRPGDVYHNVDVWNRAVVGNAAARFGSGSVVPVRQAVERDLIAWALA